MLRLQMAEHGLQRAEASRFSLTDPSPQASPQEKLRFLRCPAKAFQLLLHPVIVFIHEKLWGSAPYHPSEDDVTESRADSCIPCGTAYEFETARV